MLSNLICYQLEEQCWVGECHQWHLLYLPQSSCPKPYPPLACNLCWHPLHCWYLFAELSYDHHWKSLDLEDMILQFYWCCIPCFIWMSCTIVGPLMLSIDSFESRDDEFIPFWGQLLGWNSFQLFAGLMVQRFAVTLAFMLSFLGSQWVAIVMSFYFWKQNYKKNCEVVVMMNALSVLCTNLIASAELSWVVENEARHTAIHFSKAQLYVTAD